MRSTTSVSSVCTLLAASMVTLLSAGCGMSGTSTPAALPLTTMSGTILGGSLPIQGGLVRLMQTQSNGYGGQAVELAETTTNDYGAFYFASVGACASDQYVYVTVTGGHTNTVPGNTNAKQDTNTGAVMMLAAGSCPYITSGPANVYISEASTVAAVEALLPFLSVRAGSAPGAQIVDISAPAANNAVTPACSVDGSNTVTACTASGLGHAFANANMLVDGIFVGNGAGPSGNFRSTVPGNPNGKIPTALLNLLADAQQGCVDGTTGNNKCSALYGAATLNGGATPTDTLTALMHIIANPTHKVASVYSCKSTQPAFTPVLSSVPTDLSVAITYTGITVGGSSTSFDYIDAMALDSADNVYLALENATGEELQALSSSGAGLFQNLGAGASGYAGSATVTQLAADTMGNLFLASDKLYQASTADGSGLAAYTVPGTGANGLMGVAVDRSNAAWVSNSGTSTGSYALNQLAYSPTHSNTVVGMVRESALPNVGLSIDGGQNIWNAQQTASSNVVPYAIYTPGSTVSEYNLGLNRGNETSSIVTDSAGNGWLVSGSHLYNVGPAGASGSSPAGYAITATTSAGYTVSANAVQTAAVDGNGLLLLPDESAGVVFSFNPVTSSFSVLSPCLITTALNTSCDTVLVAPGPVQVDSSGALWVADQEAGTVLQMFGVAQPSWPQLSFGHPGVRAGLLK